MNVASNVNPADTVSVSAGTYDESVTVDVEGLTLESADGADATEVDGFQIQESGVTVSGLTATNPQIRDFGGVEITDNTDEIVTDVVIEDSVIDGPVRTFSDDADGITIRNNDITRGASRIVLGTQNGNNTNIVVRNNTFSGQQNNMFEAVFVQANADKEASVVVEGNTISDTRFNGGVFVDIRSDAAAGTVEVRDNTFENNDRDILIAEGSNGTGITVESNSFTGGGDVFITDGSDDLDLNAILNNLDNTFDPTGEVDNNQIVVT